MAEIKSSERKTYYTIMNGKVVRRVKTPTNDSVTRTNKVGKQVHEILLEGVSGNIVGAKIEPNAEYGDRLILSFRDTDEAFEVSMPVRSGYTKGFFYKMTNIDFENNVILKPFLIEQDNGSYKAFLGVYQNDVKIQSAYTKEEPNGLPQLDVVKFQGKDRYDDHKQMEFLIGILNDEIIPKIDSPVNVSPARAASQESEFAGDNPEPSDLDDVFGD